MIKKLKLGCAKENPCQSVFSVPKKSIRAQKSERGPVTTTGPHFNSKKTNSLLCLCVT